MRVLISFIQFLQVLSFAKKNLLAVYFVTCTSQVWQVLASLARTGEFGEFSKYGKGRLDHFINAKYVLIYIK